ncbi:lactonase family protein [Alienimonas sp. DA493]|uniref:lactonase family protein n=1 Tax=Alienimonas sp. DA493 TaxID=3373605 RepID=UPI0037551579
MLAAALIASVMSAAPEAAAAPIEVLIGTYTDGESRGIYRVTLDSKTGALGEPTLAAEIENPSFLALSPDGSHVYAVSEAFGGGRADGVTAFALGDDGGLTKLNAQPSAADGAKAGACHVSVSPDGEAVFAANYGGGSVASYPVREDGSLGEPATLAQHEGSSVNPRRQEAPHAHCVTPAPGGGFVLCADLGLDQILVYQVDPQTAALTQHSVTDTPPGGGPRHVAFTPDGRFAYCCLEMGNAVVALAWDGDAGTLTPLQTLPTLPEDFDGNSSTAEVRVHPNGKFVYVTNRGHDSAAVYAIGEDGQLTLVEIEPLAVDTPRGMNLTPDGRFLLACGQASDDLVSFRVNLETGALAPTGSRVNVPKAVDVLPLPAN